MNRTDWMRGKSPRKEVAKIMDFVEEEVKKATSGFIDVIEDDHAQPIRSQQEENERIQNEIADQIIRRSQQPADEITATQARRDADRYHLNTDFPANILSELSDILANVRDLSGRGVYELTWRSGQIGASMEDHNALILSLQRRGFEVTINLIQVDGGNDYNLVIRWGR